MKKSSSYSFADLAIAQRIKGLNPCLETIDEVIDWAPISQLLDRYCETGKQPNGRRAYPSLLLFKLLLLRELYQLSDRDTEARVKSDLTFMCFAGLGFEDEVPDHSRICRFRNELNELGLFDRLFEAFNSQLKARNYLVEGGTLVDAKIIRSVARPRSHEKNTHDPEAAYTKKYNTYYYGYKGHVATDVNGMILGVETTAANESDMNNLLPVLKRVKQPLGTVYADKGYDSELNRLHVKDRGGADGIMRRAKPKSGMSDADRAFNKWVSKMRYKVERAFAIMVRALNWVRSPFVGIERTHGWNQMKALCHNLIRLPGLRANLA